jgi:uncharacterized protein
MKPSEALTNNLAEVKRILERSGMSNARLFGSAVRGEDREGSDLDILVEAPPGTFLYDLADIEIEFREVAGLQGGSDDEGLPHSVRREADRGRSGAAAVRKQT